MDVTDPLNSKLAATGQPIQIIGKQNAVGDWEHGKYQIQIGDKILDTVYTSVEDAYADALMTIHVDREKIDYVTSGFATDLDNVVAGYFSKARSDALEKYNTDHGTKFNLDEWIEAEGIDNVISYIETELGMSIDELQEAIQLDWAKIKDTWKSGLQQCYKLSKT